jgi:hypothetical protein
MKYTQYIFCIILTSTCLLSKAQEVHISKGLNVSLDGSVNLVLNNMALSNSGQFKAEGGTVQFTGGGNTARSIIAGNSPLVFHHLTIDRTSGDVLLENRIFVNGNLTLTKGNLDLNNYSIDLGSSGRLEGENSDAHITGKNGGFIKATVDLNESQRLNPGNLGLQLTTGRKVGRVSITRGHLQQVNKDGELSMGRYYDIDAAYGGTLETELVAGYLDDESMNQNPNDMVLWKSDNEGRMWSMVDRKNNTYRVNETIGRSQLRLTYFRPGKDAASNMQMQLYPNPVVEKFTLSFTYPKQEEIAVSIYNNNGQLVASRKVTVVAGFNKIDWQVGNYPAGNYQLRFPGEKIRTVAFTKQ